MDTELKEKIDRAAATGDLDSIDRILIEGAVDTANYIAGILPRGLQQALFEDSRIAETVRRVMGNPEIQESAKLAIVEKAGELHQGRILLDVLIYPDSLGSIQTRAVALLSETAAAYDEREWIKLVREYAAEISPAGGAERLANAFASGGLVELLLQLRQIRAVDERRAAMHVFPNEVVTAIRNTDENQCGLLARITRDDAHYTNDQRKTAIEKLAGFGRAEAIWRLMQNGFDLTAEAERVFPIALNNAQENGAIEELCTLYLECANGSRDKIANALWKAIEVQAVFRELKNFIVFTKNCQREHSNQGQHMD
ncbi:hypothetical protein HZC07_04060 [Candidatus Micrarchaeota archaeon]|nr:hypothetical protein [Candidatus Micrarchaeota archaeon]